MYLPTVELRVGGAPVRTAFPYHPRVARAFRAAHVSLVHSFSPFFVGHMARRLARTHNIPCVLTYQTNYPDYVHFLPFGAKLESVPFLSNLVRSMTRDFFVPRVCNGFDHLIVPTRTTALALRRYGVTTEITELPVGFDRRHSQPEVEHRTQCGSNTLHFLTVGRLSREKNLEFLVRAFAHASEALAVNTILTVVGDGPERRVLERLVDRLGIANRVCFTGEVDHAAVWGYYSAADVFLFASSTETQGFVVCEALISGVPVIAINAQGPNEFIADGREGFLVSPTVMEFSSAMCRLGSSATLRRTMGANAYRTGLRLNSSQYSAGLVALYTTLTSGIKRPPVAND